LDIVLSVLLFTNSDYPFGTFKLFFLVLLSSNFQYMFGKVYPVLGH